MQLTFEHYESGIATGGNPVAFHSPDGIIQVIFTDSGLLQSVQAQTPMDVYDALEWTEPEQAAQDAGITHLKLKYLPKVNLFVLWHSANRQRKAVFLMKQEVSKYLEIGTITISQQDAPVASLSLSLENPEGIISAEVDTESEAFPGTRVIVFFKSGGTDRIRLGGFYIDRINSKSNDGKVSLEARNLSGKLLADQTFDEDNSYETGNWSDIVEAVLADSSVPLYAVESNTRQQAVDFPPDMIVLEGLKELLKLTDDWKIVEDEENRIVIGSVTYKQMDQASTYYFNRGEDCFSRERTLEDAEVYSRVCVHNSDFTIEVYKDVIFHAKWNLPRKKTLYVELPEGASSATAETYATNLASAMSSVGVIETFMGPFRPWIQPGDAAEIDDGDQTELGLITQVRHSFGKAGYASEFTVDSGGQLRKLNINDWLERINKKKDSLRITITE